jgi:hypothetical protein
MVVLKKVASSTGSKKKVTSAATSFLPSTLLARFTFPKIRLVRPFHPQILGISGFAEHNILRSYCNM